ncbi:hypothetical protein [uncultured Methanobrevibacter sp.]|uniref:hypothetical protein n=1 Tax=uncultured Methanobrevibacter sp. TaxID=253161 RepID=UPI0025EE6E80|nr:hypothetical protein [uncultured Methanobrevibacter sp.]
MIDNVDDLKNKSLKYKPELKREQIHVPIGDMEYDFRISGIGEKSFKIEKYIKYDDIIEAIEAGNDDGLESIILELVDSFEPKEE